MVSGIRRFGNAVKKPTDAGGALDPMMVPASSPSAPDDALGAYPTQVRVPVLEGRRYLWTTRAFALGFYLSCILNIVLGFLIFSLVPLKKTQPFLVTFQGKEQQIVRVEPFVEDTSGFYLMTEQLAAEYVRMRETIDKNEQVMLERWGDYMRLHTDDALYKDFVVSIEQPFKEIQSKSFTVRIEIASIERRSGNFIEVYFTKIAENARAEEVSRQQYIAQINYTFLEKNVSNAEKYINPLGFTVTGYNLKGN